MPEQKIEQNRVQDRTEVQGRAENIENRKKTTEIGYNRK